MLNIHSITQSVDNYQRGPEKQDAQYYTMEKNRGCLKSIVEAIQSKNKYKQRDCPAIKIFLSICL